MLSPARAAALGRVKPRTLFEVRGSISGFAQDGDRVVWANSAESCSRYIHLRQLSTGKIMSLVSRKGATCTEGEDRSVSGMALAGTRALWTSSFYESHLAFHVSLYSAAAGDRLDRKLGSIPTRNDEKFQAVPMAGDGATLAFADISDAEEESATGVYRVASGLNLLPESEETRALAVSGGRLAVVRTVVPECVCASNPEWSPDGRTIFFGAGKRAPALYSMNADGTGLRRLPLSGWAGEVGEFLLSPDGRSLVYRRSRIGLGVSRSQIVVASSDGTGDRLLAEGSSPNWSPDSRSIAYDSSSRISVVPAQGGTPRLITPETATPGGLAASSEDSRPASAGTPSTCRGGRSTPSHPS
jgi:dipeptidyl aminopeptidase/acylaminoacyl peptidase